MPNARVGVGRADRDRAAHLAAVLDRRRAARPGRGMTGLGVLREVVVVGHDHGLAGDEHLAHDALVDAEPLADQLVAHAVSCDHDRQPRIIAVAHAHRRALHVQDAAGLLGDAAQQRRGLAAAAHDPCGVGQRAGAPRQLGHLRPGLEQAPGPDQDHARRESENHGDQPVRPQLGVHRAPVPDVVQPHRGGGQDGDHEDAELVVSRIRHAGRSADLSCPSIGRQAARLSARPAAPSGAATRRRRRAGPLGPSSGCRLPGARTRPSRTARDRSATRIRRPGGPSRGDRRSRACRPGCRSRARRSPLACRGSTGLPFSSRPWCERTMCSTARARSGGKPAICSIWRAHEVVAERDLAEQLAVVGEVDRERVARVGLDLADVVDQRAGHRDVAVDARERAPDRAHGLAHGQRVLQQAVQVGLVVELRRRRAAEPLPHVGALAEQRVQQLPQVRVAHGARSGGAGLPPSARRWRRRVRQVGEAVLALLRDAADCRTSWAP